MATASLLALLLTTAQAQPPRLDYAPLEQARPFAVDLTAMISAAVDAADTPEADTPEAGPPEPGAVDLVRYDLSVMVPPRPRATGVRRITDRRLLREALRFGAGGGFRLPILSTAF